MTQKGDACKKKKKKEEQTFKKRKKKKTENFLHHIAVTPSECVLVPQRRLQQRRSALDGAEAMMLMLPGRLFRTQAMFNPAIRT